MSRGAGATLLALAVALVAGCRAEATAPPDLTPVYDLYTPPPDLAMGPDFACPSGPEQCSDGCDNDANGLTDAEDPACTPTVLATTTIESVVARWRLGTAFDTFFMPPVASSYATAYRNDVVPGEVWLTSDLAFIVQRFRVSDGMETWKRTDLKARDICFFGKVPILVQQTGGSGVLHLLKPDGTDANTVPVAAGTPTACASDGQVLYVPIHAGAARSVFVVFDANYNQVAMVPIPPSLTEDRCLDLAWTSRGFYGLFVDGNGMADSGLDATRAYPFAMDGGVGAPIEAPDGSLIHSLGEYAP